MSGSKRVHWPIVELTSATGLLLGAGILTIVLSAGARSGMASGGAGTLPPADLTTFVTILSRNTAAALGLFSGLLTAGLGTVVFLLLIGVMLGWSIGTAFDVLGVAETLVRAWAYTPFEIAGLIVAGAAGLMPVLHFLRGGRIRSYVDQFARSFRWLAFALLLIVVGAVVETASIAIHN